MSRREDLTLRPLRPERSALPDCATPRCYGKINRKINYYPIQTNNADNITIDNYGTIQNNGTAQGKGNTAIDLGNSSNITIYNRST